MISKTSIRILLVSFSTLVSLAASATTPPAFNCADLRNALVKIPVFASNLANVNTTRTPDGTPYKRVEIKCREASCETTTASEFRFSYEPRHPDANRDGYVKYPQINVAQEFASLNTSAAELKLLASQDICGAKAITSANSAIIKYGADSYIQTDTFLFTADGKVQTWTRTQKNGTTSNYAFNSDGTLSVKP
jgi:flagellar basal-body rod protein FlgC